MSEKVTAVALFFDDAELGAHLRNALSEYGARIAHEGPIGTFDENALRNAGVDVLVVNLDEAVDEATLDRLYGLVKAGKTPVVFNDAQASRQLDGWDRARWARHLAAKALNTDSIDPPRPDNSREVNAPEPEELVEAAPVEAGEQAELINDPMAGQVLVHDESAPDSETLAAELEALLESDDSADQSEEEFSSNSGSHEVLPELLDDERDAHDAPQHSATENASSNFEEDFGSGLKFKEDDELPPLHDGDFGDIKPAAHGAGDRALTDFDADFSSNLKFSEDDELPPLHDGNFGEHDAYVHSPSNEPAPVEKARFNIDHLSLASEEDVKPPEIVKETLAQQTPTTAAPEWGFVAEEDYAQPAKKDFGVEKVSAADYLAPDAEDDGSAPQIKPGLSLELVSNEEALAPPQNYESAVAHETHLQELDTAFARLLVLGAARESDASLRAFLSTLPNDLKLPILLTQHQANGSAEQLAQSLASQSKLPVKVAATGSRARAGEVLVVPRGQQVRVMRDGHIEVTAAADASEQSPSIDISFTMAANVFGRDALAIVFAGKATDAVAGAQAIHDRGGQVWVESSAVDHYSDMVHGVLAERLASFSGSPQELAVRLVEDFR
jgi:chemotaxis response regulator CheB